MSDARIGRRIGNGSAAWGATEADRIRRCLRRRSAAAIDGMEPACDGQSRHGQNSQALPGADAAWRRIGEIDEMSADDSIPASCAEDAGRNEMGVAADRRGRLRYCMIGALLILGPLILLAISRFGAPTFEKVTDEDTLARARSALILVSADWCGLCRRMEHELARDPSFRAQAGGLRLLRVDWSDPESSLARTVSARFDVKGVPTMILLDGAGQVAAKWQGMTEVAKISEAVKTVSAGLMPAPAED
ncbi:MAG: thioredoxin family protein [Succinivibrionaceae bacterium]|nr:thioredoxin family protein [Succinivibrionaceae bacterium]